MFRAFVIEVDPDKDISDVVQIARTLGKVAFRTEKKVKVKRIIFDAEIGYIAVVQSPESESGSEPLGVRGNEKGAK